MTAGRRSHLVWIGPAVAFAGAVSYFLVFARWPALRDFPWVNLPWVLAGLGLSLAGWGRSPRGRRKLAAVGLAGSTTLATLFCGYVFFLSYLLPAPTALSESLVAAPDFTLTDAAGRPQALADLRGRKVVLVFYRGHW